MINILLLMFEFFIYILKKIYLIYQKMSSLKILKEKGGKDIICKIKKKRINNINIFEILFF